LQSKNTQRGRGFSFLRDATRYRQLFMTSNIFLVAVCPPHPPPNLQITCNFAHTDRKVLWCHD